MSTASVDVVLGLVDAVNRRDVDAMVSEFYAPDAEFIPALGSELEGAVYRGSDEIRSYYDDEFFAVWERVRIVFDDVQDRGDGMVLATGRVAGEGKHSGALVDHSWAYAFKVVDGRVAWHRNFLDRDDALAAIEQL